MREPDFMPEKALAKYSESLAKPFCIIMIVKTEAKNRDSFTFLESKQLST